MAEPENMFESVTQRFEESIELLESLRQSLNDLTRAEEHQAEVSRSVDGAATQLRETAKTLDAATETAQSAMTELRSTLTAANQILQGAEVDTVRADIAVLREALDAGLATTFEDTRTIRELLAHQIEEARGERDKAREELMQSRHRIEELEGKIELMPDRQRRRLGL